MNRRTVLGVALRVVGAWCLIHALDRGLLYVVYYASLPWEMRSVSESRVSWMVAAASFSIFLVPLGLVLLRYADAIAGRLVLRGAVTVEDAVVPVQSHRGLLRAPGRAERSPVAGGGGGFGPGKANREDTVGRTSPSG